MSSGGVGKKPRGDDDEFEDAGFDDEPMALEDAILPSEGEVLESGDDFIQASWSRGVHTDVSTNEEDLAFQWCDIDVVSGSPLITNPNGSKVIGSTVGPVPILRLYGVTAKGSSVLAFVHGFTPYMYASIPSNIELSLQNLASIRNALDQRVGIMALNSLYLIAL